MKHDNDNIKHQYEEFFANGGTITKCPKGRASGLWDQTIRCQKRAGKNGHETGITLGNQVRVTSSGIGGAKTKWY